MNQQSTDLEISVVIPAYNCGAYLCRAVDSVLRQTYSPHEIIVVDDGSTDDTVAAAQSYGERIRLIVQENAGASVARNRGVEAAGGEWIAFLDGDDEWLENRLELTVRVLVENPDLVWATGNYYECLCEKQRRAAATPEAELRDMLGGRNYFHDFFVAAARGVWGHTDTMVIKKSALMEAGLFRPGQLKANDIDMWLRIAYRHPKTGFVVEPTAVYHLDIQNSIVRKYRKDDIFVPFLDRHVSLAKQLGAWGRFRPCCVFMAKRWMRSLLFYGQAEVIKNIIETHGELFSRRYKFFMRLMTLFPGLTKFILRGISFFVRNLRLRRRVVRKP